MPLNDEPSLLFNEFYEFIGLHVEAIGKKKDGIERGPEFALFQLQNIQPGEAGFFGQLFLGIAVFGAQSFDDGNCCFT